MERFDNKIAQSMKEEIEDSVLSDEMGEFIDSLADLETDKDIIDDVLGGNENE